MYQPLADALRPQELSDVCGQQHILGENGLLRRIIESGSVPNMIFYGPSGTGKTTVANLIAKKTQRKLCKLNATTASSADIKEIYAQLDTFLAPNGVLLYLDEIQYFNKKQQQTLLEYIENGKITLIASTTENRGRAAVWPRWMRWPDSSSCRSGISFCGRALSLLRCAPICRTARGHEKFCASSLRQR